MSRYLITGGTGFVGCHLASSLQEDGHEVIITGKIGENSYTSLVVGFDFDKLPWSDLGPIDCLFHLAAITDTTVTDADAMLRTNTRAAETLFGQAIAHGVKQIVYASSCAVYGDGPTPFREDQAPKPLNVYAQSKLLLDQQLWRIAGLQTPIIGLRFSNVYGQGEWHKGTSASMVSRILWQMLDKKRPKLFASGEQKRDWVYVADVVRALKLAGSSGRSGIYNVGSGQSVSFNDVVKTWEWFLRFNLEPEYMPNPHEGAYQSLTSVDIGKAERDLGYRPEYQLFDGMAHYLEGR